MRTLQKRVPMMATKANMTGTEEPLGRKPTAAEVDPGSRVGEAWAVLMAAMDKWRLPLESQFQAAPQGSPHQTD